MIRAHLATSLGRDVSGEACGFFVRRASLPIATYCYGSLEGGVYTAAAAPTELLPPCAWCIGHGPSAWAMLAFRYHGDT